MSYYMHDITWPEFQAKKGFRRYSANRCNRAACAASAAVYRCKDRRKVFLLSGKGTGRNYHANTVLWL